MSIDYSIYGDIEHGGIQTLSLNPYPRILEKNPKTGKLCKRHLWKKNPIKIQNDKFWEHLRASFLEKKSRLFLWLYSLYFLQKFWEHFEASILEKKSNNFQIVSNLWNIVRLWFWLANRLILSHYDVFNAVLWLVKSSVVESSVFSLTNQLEVKKFAWIFFPKMTLWNVPKILKFENCFLERKIT